MLTMYRRITVSLYVIMVLSLLVSASSRADQTYWRGNPAGPGGWFVDTNWSAGVPGFEDVACIYNGGTAVIARGHAEAGQLNIGTVLQPAYAEEIKSVHPWPGTGAVWQIGGTAAIKGNIFLSGSLRRPGSYALARGRLSTRNIVVGRGSGSGRFTQFGGVNRVERELRVGDLRRTVSSSPQADLKSSLGVYRLLRGRLMTGQTSVGVAGRGRFVQNGGVHRVKDLLAIGGPQPWLMCEAVPVPIDEIGEPVILDGPEWAGEVVETPLLPHIAIPKPPPSKGRYVLRRGRLVARRQEIRRTGAMKQTGGKNRVAYLAVHRGGRYDYLGGRLRINAGLDLDGVLDFGDSRTVITAGAALLNFSRGDVLNSQNAALIAGPRSLTIFAADFDPKKEFRYFHTDGMVHFAGSDLKLAPRECFSGWGTIDDHVESKGWIDATPGGSINLRKGLFVHEGTTDLGAGRLTVLNDRSGIKSGRLIAGSLGVGNRFVKLPLTEVSSQALINPRFVQKGGRTVISRSLAIGRGAYELHGGSLSAGSIGVGGHGYFIGPKSEFIQTGGSCKTDGVLRVGRFPFRRLCITDCDLEVAEATPIEIDDDPIFIEATAIPIPKASATYRMSGGRLSAGSLCLYGNGRWSNARFIQTGGDVGVQRGLYVYGRNAGYTMIGGRLSTPVLRVGSRHSLSGGTLAILDRQAEIEVSQRLSFGHGSTFVAVPGSTIHITGPKPETTHQWPGSTFENFSTDPAALSGLGNLTLIFEGGDEFVATFEVAGEDLGPGPGGYFDNFTLDTLCVGGDDVANVQLVDLFDNQPDSEDPEALYVKNLIIGAGSSLDLNGLNLYYLNDGLFTLFLESDAGLDGFVSRAGLDPCNCGEGSPPAPAPEPATASLLLLGAVAMLMRKRKSRA